MASGLAAPFCNSRSRGNGWLGVTRGAARPILRRAYRRRVNPPCLVPGKPMQKRLFPVRPVYQRIGAFSHPDLVRDHPFLCTFVLRGLILASLTDEENLLP